MPLEDLTQLELEFAMTENEWELKPLQSSSDLARIPDKRGGRKLWFQGANGAFFSAYLICLLSAEKLFDAGITAVYHGQIAAYYLALLALQARAEKSSHPVAIQVLPFKPAVYYRA